MKQENGQEIIRNDVASHVAIAFRDVDTNALSFIQALPNRGVILTHEEEFFRSWPNTTTFYSSTVIEPHLRANRAKAAKIALKQVFFIILLIVINLQNLIK